MNGVHHPVIHGTMAGVEPGGIHYNGPFEELAAAIVTQAVKDYVNLIKDLWLGEGKNPMKKREMLQKKIELEAFFHSGWYETLTDIDPEKLMARCNVLGKQKAQEAIIAANKRKVAKEKKITQQGGSSK